LRVLQICAAYKPAYIYGGPTMSVSMLAEQLVKAGVSVEVFTTTANGKTELDVIPGKPVNVDGVTVRYFKRLTKDHSHYSPALLKALWKEVRSFDIVHISAWWNLVSIFSCLIAVMRKVPVVLSARGTLSPYSFQNKNIGPKWAIHNLLGKRLLNKCYVHVTSEREKEAMNKITHPKSVTVLPNFVKLATHKPAITEAPSTNIRLLFFSRIEEKKGLDILLNALTLVSVPYHLTIAGDGGEGYVSSLKTLAANNKVDDNVSWVGFRHQNKFELLNEHNLFVLPSHDENFGNSVIESLSVGTAVLISEHVGLADYVKRNDFGWICKTNEDAVANAINDIFTNHKEDLERIRKNAPEIIEDDFDGDNLVKRYINMYNQVLNNG